LEILEKIMQLLDHILTRITKTAMIAGMSLALCAVASNAQAEERKYKIEAAYLYSFFNHITWPGYKTPQDMQKPVICVYGNDPILPYLDYVRGKVAGERQLSMRVVGDGSSAERCHILFMRHRAMQTASLDPKILTVFKPDDPLDRAGLIELSDDAERIALKIDQSQLETQGFLVSSRLLALAQRVR